MSSQDKSLVDMQIESIAASQQIPLKDAAAIFKENSEHVIDFDALPKQNHHWVDRGLKFTCENAGHPYHEVWKARKPMTK